MKQLQERLQVLAMVDPDKAPVTEPYVRDLILEAHRLVTAHAPHCGDFRYIEIFENISFGRHDEAMLIYYNPLKLKECSLNQLCQGLAQVMHDYTMYLINEHVAPEGTVFQ